MFRIGRARLEERKATPQRVFHDPNKSKKKALPRYRGAIESFAVILLFSHFFF